MLIRILTKINYKAEYILWKFNIGTSRTCKNNSIFFDIWSNLNNFITSLSLRKTMKCGMQHYSFFQKNLRRVCPSSLPGTFSYTRRCFLNCAGCKHMKSVKRKKKKAVLFLLIVSVAIFFSNAQLDLVSLSCIYGIEMSKLR